MLRFNRCVRCNGETFLEKDVYGWYETCLQCGYLHDIEVAYKAAETDERLLENVKNI